MISSLALHVAARTVQPRPSVGLHHPAPAPPIRQRIGKRSHDRCRGVVGVKVSLLLKRPAIGGAKVGVVLAEKIGVSDDAEPELYCVGNGRGRVALEVRPAVLIGRGRRACDGGRGQVQQNEKRGACATAATAVAGPGGNTPEAAAMRQLERVGSPVRRPGPYTAAA